MPQGTIGLLELCYMPIFKSIKCPCIEMLHLPFKLLSPEGHYKPVDVNGEIV